MKHSIAIAFLISTAAFAQAPEKVQPKLSDFAMQLPLGVSGDNGVVQVRLPLSVYQHAQSATLADVRVFNSVGQPVPFAFFRPNHLAKINSRDSEAKIFPVVKAVAADPGQLELDVRASQDGTLLSVHAKSRGAAKDGQLTALILDLGKPQSNEVLDSVQLFLPQAATGYRADLVIEQSDDLKLWDRVAQSRVDWLKDQSQTNSLINDRIELSGSSRYMRIQWLEGTPLQFARVVARWQSSAIQAEEDHEVVLQAKPGKFAGDWVYASSSAIAANEIGLNLPNANTVMPVSIGYYRQQLTPTRKWIFETITNNTFYRLHQNGAERVSSRLHIAPQSNSEWVVRPQTATAAAPDLVLRWRPHTIAFTAQGSGGEQQPFILAFGASAENLKQWLTSEAPLSLVAPGYSDIDLSQLEQAIAGEPVATIAKQATAEVEPMSTKMNNRTLLLWSVLIFGTLLLGGMSWRLYKQMGSESGS